MRRLWRPAQLKSLEEAVEKVDHYCDKYDVLSPGFIYSASRFGDGPDSEPLQTLLPRPSIRVAGD